jgi:hypothetical protein
MASKKKTKPPAVKTRRDLLVEFLATEKDGVDGIDVDDLLEHIGADPNAPDPKVHPVANVRWVELDKTQANNWNPNKVAPNEMRLLHLSISNDGYTQPVVTIYDEETERFVVVDGFHRRQTMLNFADIRESTGGRLPVVVIDKPINDRMASTVRHNRARGKHSVGGMGQIVFGMLEGGWSDEEICKQLGMEADELVRLKHVTGFAKLFEDVEYRRAWETRKQIKIRRAFKEGEATDAIEDDPEDLEAKALAEAEGEQVADV